MARTARAISSTGIYAVILRAAEAIFAEVDMKEAFMNAANTYLGDGLLAIKITDERVEMLLEESEKGISMDMKPLITSFARTYNREYDHEGKVFIDRFKSVPVEDDDTKDECIAYLEGGELAWPFAGVRETQSKPAPEKKPAAKQAKPAKKTEKKKTAKRPAAKPVKKPAEVKKPEPEEKKKEEPAPVRRRNELPSWLL